MNSQVRYRWQQAISLSPVELHEQTEEVLLNCLITLIDSACSLARSAESLYGVESSDHAKRVSMKAWNLYHRCAARLGEVCTDRVQQISLSHKLIEVRAILEALPTPQNESTAILP